MCLFLSKKKRELPNAKAERLPSIVYQYLLLSTMVNFIGKSDFFLKFVLQKGCKDLILKGILSHICYREQHPSARKGTQEKEWKQIVGTVIFQIDFAVKQDQV